MELWEVMKKRSSVRSYTSENVKPSDIDKVLAAAALAPVGMGAYENIHITVITNPELLDKIDKATAEKIGKPEAHPVYGVPVMIVVSTRPGKFVIPGIESDNCGCIIENMMLAATDIGLGSVYLLAATEVISQNSDLLVGLNLPDGFTPTGSIGLGYADLETLGKKTVHKIAANVVA